MNNNEERNMNEIEINGEVYVKKDSVIPAEDGRTVYPWQIGVDYFIRTVTMHLVGKLEFINDKELLLSTASWIADSGRFNNALKTGCFDEIEPFVSNVIVNRSSIIDATKWLHELPKDVK